MLNTIEMMLEPVGNTTTEKNFAHVGIVGSGDLEILFEKATTEKVKVVLTTPVAGFDDIWKLVFTRFIAQAQLGPVDITINDNNATPAVVTQRLLQVQLQK